MRTNRLGNQHTLHHIPSLTEKPSAHRGNLLVSQPPLIQPKLTIGQPGERYEQEADRIADLVMRMPEPHLHRQVEPEEEEEEEEEETLQAKPLAGQVTPLVQSQVEPEKEEEEEALQAKPLAAQVTPLVQRQVEPEEEEEEEPIQTKLAAGVQVQRQKEPEEEEEEKPIKAKPTPGQTSQVTPDLQASINSLRGGGQPLDPLTRTFIEPRLGYDFSQVRVHTDSRAAETAQALNARAFTVGRDIVFSAGQYVPEASAGKRLLVHELTHVMQQVGAPSPGSLEMSSSQDSIPEEEAEQAAQVLAGVEMVKTTEHRFAQSIARQSPKAPGTTIQPPDLNVIVKRYKERIDIYREYYAKRQYREQEKYFGRAIVNVIIEIKERLGEFKNPEWIDCISDFLQKRWFIGIKGAPAFKAKYGQESVRKFQDLESSNMWQEALRAAAAAETDPTSFDTNAKQEAAIKRFPQDIQKAFKELKGGDPVFEDDKEYATYLQTIAHDYIDLSDAMVNCGCGSGKDWALIIDILTDESAEGVIAWFGDVLGVADEAMENFITLTIKRAAKMSAERKKSELVCPDID